jgi:hypothetical protein
VSEYIVSIMPCQTSFPHVQDSICVDTLALSCSRCLESSIEVDVCCFPTKFINPVSILAAVQMFCALYVNPDKVKGDHLVCNGVVRTVLMMMNEYK